MNDNDSERSLGFLREINYRETMHPGDADLILINTCSIRDKAEHKVYSTLGRYKALKAENPGLVIGVSGCVAQQQGERLLKRVPYLDMVVGPHNIHKLKDLIGEVTVKKKRVVEVTLRETIDADEYGVSTAIKPPKAFVSIMRGCNNFCTYCIVPYTRGREVSRKSSEILREISALAGSGIREVTLLGQNVNSYGAPGGALSFPGLLRGVAGISGIERIRFVTSHPKDISDELIRLFGEEQKLARHIHLPVQSGADRVLEMMGRGYTRAEYLLKIKTLRRLYPDISITTDIIVGFPAETDSDFDATMALIEEAGFDNIFSFMYSRRPGTAAAGFELRIPEETSKERLLKLQETQRAITLARSRALIGRTMTVLAEGPSKADASELTGRTSCNRVVNFMAPDVPAGILTDVSITGAYPNSLRGTVMQRGSLCS